MALTRLSYFILAVAAVAAAVYAFKGTQTAAIVAATVQHVQEGGSVQLGCVVNGPYHVAAAMLQLGLGNLSTSAVCQYGADTDLNSACSLTCKGASLDVIYHYFPGILHRFPFDAKMTNFM